MGSLSSARKASSPLFGTLFFAALSIFIGLVAMASGIFFLNQVREPASQDTGAFVCPENIPFRIEKACYSISGSDSGTITLSLKSLAEKEISLSLYWLRIRQADNLGFEAGSGILKKGQARKFDFAFNNSLGSPDMISVLPVIKKDNRDYLCTSNAAEYKIMECNS